MIRGVLFDMDGVLVDTEEYICRAAIEMFREIGLNACPEDFRPFVGMGEIRYIGGVAEKYGFEIDIFYAKERTYLIYEKITRGIIKPLPGALEFIDLCRSKGFRLALATSADKRKMVVNMRAIGLTMNDFNSVISGLDVKRTKPFPDIYLLAAKKAGLKPGECLVVEDAVNGIRAARDAGCRTLAVTNSFSGDDLREADWLCDSLEMFPADALKW
jgi:beta-phosphoglucomutase